MILFMYNNIVLFLVYKEGDKMPDTILLEDIIEEMLDNISYAKLRSYLNEEDE